MGTWFPVPFSRSLSSNRRFARRCPKCWWPYEMQRNVAPRLHEQTTAREKHGRTLEREYSAATMSCSLKARINSCRRDAYLKVAPISSLREAVGSCDALDCCQCYRLRYHASSNESTPTLQAPTGVAKQSLSSIIKLWAAF